MSDDTEAVAMPGHRRGAAGDARATWGNALYELFDQKVEEKLIQPTFITMHPVDVSPWPSGPPRDPRLTERFGAVHLPAAARWARLPRAGTGDSVGRRG